MEQGNLYTGGPAFFVVIMLSQGTFGSKSACSCAVTKKLPYKLHCVCIAAMLKY